METEHDAERIRALEARIARLERTIARLAPDADPDVEGDEQRSAGGRSSRRTAIKAVAAAGGAALASTLVADRAAATDGAALLVGETNTSADGDTRVFANSGGLYANKNIITALDSPFGSGFPSAIGGFAAGNRVTNGVYGYSEDRTSSTTTGYALVAWATSGARAPLLLRSNSGDPRADTYPHRSGSFRSDSGGNLWFCTSSGTPGTWHKLAGPATAGAVHAIDPKRVYDSRLTGGALVADANRVISVAEGIDLNTGDVTVTDLVPPGARAILFNLAVINTAGSGFLAVTPGDAIEFGAATINWFASGQIANNGSFAKLDADRQVRVWAGGGNADFTIDITGYLL